MEDQKKANPMYFACLEVENVKSFGGKQLLNLRDSQGALSPWTLILGDNGVGKTTLLKCLAWMMPVELPEDEKLNIAKQLLQEGVDLTTIEKATKISQKELEKIQASKQSGDEKNTKVKIKPLMDNFEEESAFNSIIRFGEDVEMNVQAQFTTSVALNETPLQSDLVTIGIKLKRVGKELQDIEDINHLTTEELPEFNSPNLFAYGASRHMASENFDKSELKDPTYNLLSYSGDLYDAEEVLLDLYNTSVEEKSALMQRKIERLENGGAEISVTKSRTENIDTEAEGRATKHLQKVKEILTKLLPHIDHPDCIIINQSAKKEGGLSNSKIVEIKTPFGQVGLSDLSLGYQTMLAWVVDLAIRMFWQDPDGDDPLAQPAVVIIDEIDLHLHPKWQRTLKQYLIEHFPATQFICTAHSPFMAQASEDENFCVLHEINVGPAISEVHIENDPTIIEGWHIGQVVTNLSGLPEVSWEIEERLFNRRRVLLDKENRSPQDEEEIKKLHKQILDLPGYESEEDRKLLSQIRKTAELLTKKGGEHR